MTNDANEQDAPGPLAAPESGGVDNGPAENVLSFSWHAKAFVFLVVFVTALLFGVYQPAMRSLSDKAMQEGDAFLAHARVLQSDTGRANPDLERIDEKIHGLYQYVATYMEFMRVGASVLEDPGHPLNRAIVQGLVRLEPDLRTLDEEIIRLGEEHGLADSFAFLFQHLRERGANVEQRLSVTVGKPLDVVTYSQQYYDGLSNTAIPDFLDTVKKVRDLFLVEPCFDRAMAKYIDAIGYSRTWQEPRIRMAHLYRDRKWPEFAMMEYLRTLKLDPSSARGAEAYAEVRKYLGQHPEADYYCALAELVLEREDEALRHLRLFLGTQPTNLLAPKAAELAGYLEAGNRTYVRQFVRNEIWI